MSLIFIGCLIAVDLCQIKLHLKSILTEVDMFQEFEWVSKIKKRMVHAKLNKNESVFLAWL